jgi:aerobic-type carbon monoxide dehydrogenase small subunit (CoxS/CutS family)
MPADRVRVTIDGVSVEVPAGTSVAAAILSIGRSQLRTSLAGEPRGPLCGMGACFECVVRLNGQANVRSCLRVCIDGLEVATYEREP